MCFVRSESERAAIYGFITSRHIDRMVAAAERGAAFIPSKVVSIRTGLDWVCGLGALRVTFAVVVSATSFFLGVLKNPLGLMYTT